MDKRSQQDRRQKPTPLINKYLFWGQRRYHRRNADRQQSYYIDRFGLKAIAVFIIIIILSIYDAKITLRIIETGGQELNPILRFALSKGPNEFLIVKYITTGVCLLLLMIHKNFYIFNGRLNVKTIVIGILLLYVLLIFYELFLLVAIQ